ncbi:MAG: LarC family nickel insertion protein, partial [Gammaproteobacteria bacterium]|nr:LarC family nickel insertion protein [Gammaproteobacteria bacterium]
SLSGYRLEVRSVEKRSIQAKQFQVMLQDANEERLADGEYLEIGREMAGEGHHHPHEIAHTASHDHPDHEHDHPHHKHDHPHHHHHEEDPFGHDPSESEESHSHSHHHSHRAFPEIIDLIQGSQMSPEVKSLACRIFERLAEAEGKVHGMPKEAVHFHEVGGVDAIIDITSAAIGLELLGIDEVIASPVHLGSGFVRSAHGILPIPAPATANLLLGVPTYSGETRGELVTPTGAAILTTIAKNYGPMPLMKVRAIGYGAGSRDRDFPNVVRAFLGERPAQDSLSWPETNTRIPRSPFPSQ